jgi:hypothetical protein
MGYRQGGRGGQREIIALISLISLCFFRLDYASMTTRQCAAVTMALIAVVHIASAQAPDGFTSLFNGRDFTGWKLPAGDNGHWRIVDGVIDYDAESDGK